MVSPRKRFRPLLTGHFAYGVGHGHIAAVLLDHVASYQPVYDVADPEKLIGVECISTTGYTLCTVRGFDAKCLYDLYVTEAERAVINRRRKPPQMEDDQ